MALQQGDEEEDETSSHRRAHDEVDNVPVATLDCDAEEEEPDRYLC